MGSPAGPVARSQTPSVYPHHCLRSVIHHANPSAELRPKSGSLLNRRQKPMVNPIEGPGLNQTDQRGPGTIVYLLQELINQVQLFWFDPPFTAQVCSEPNKPPMTSCKPFAKTLTKNFNSARLAELWACNHPIPPKHARHLSSVMQSRPWQRCQRWLPGRTYPSGEVSKTAAKLLKRGIRTAGKVITKVRPKGITYLVIRSQHVPIRGLDRIDIPAEKPSHFFLMRSRVRFHSFVENSF